MDLRRKTVGSTIAAALCATTAFAAMPAKVLAGPMIVSSAPSVTVQVEKVYYRRNYGRRPYYGRYYPRRYYGYDPTGAIVAGAALGLLGAGIAGAYGYPGYYYSYPGYYYGYPSYNSWGW